jgi:hypothetical protein
MPSRGDRRNLECRRNTSPARLSPSWFWLTPMPEHSRRRTPSFFVECVHRPTDKRALRCFDAATGASDLCSPKRSVVIGPGVLVSPAGASDYLGGSQGKVRLPAGTVCRIATSRGGAGGQLLAKSIPRDSEQTGANNYDQSCRPRVCK